MVPTSEVWRGPGPVMPLPEAPQDVLGVTFDVDGRAQSIGQFLDEICCLIATYYRM